MPCSHRCKDINVIGEHTGPVQCDEDDWVDTNQFYGAEQLEEVLADLQINTEMKCANVPKDEFDDEEAVDMDDFLEDNLLDDDQV